MRMALDIPKRKQLSHGIGIGVLVILHIVGIVGLHLDNWEPLFRTLTPVNLIVSTAVVLAFHREWNLGFVLALAGTFAFGFGLEVLGVKTGWIFGEYQYGATLGVKVAEVPLTMGLNWLVPVYGIAKILERFDWHLVVKAAVGAVMMVALDLFIEPTAIQLDFWQWAGNTIPIQNYLAWLVASFLLLMVVIKPMEGKKNPVGAGLYLIQFCFFAGFGLVRLLT